MSVPNSKKISKTFLLHSKWKNTLQFAPDSPVSLWLTVVNLIFPPSALTLKFLKAHRDGETTPSDIIHVSVDAVAPDVCVARCGPY